MRNEFAIMILKKRREDILSKLAPESSLKRSLETIDYTVALTKAINLLEHDIEKPLKDAMSFGVFRNYISGYCPCCNTVIVSDCINNYVYCRNCGQKVGVKNNV
jgi:hypothetical protein